MATTFEVTVYRPESQAPLLEADFEAAFREVTNVDRLMSLYRPDSELSLLNAKAGQGPTPASPKMVEVLRASDAYAKLSGGAFDVTVQPLVDLWGFYRVRDASVPPQEKIDAVLPFVGPDRMSISTAAGTVALKAGGRIDLGGIAKGYAVDLALGALRARGVPAALVNLGGNIGVLGQAPGGRPWVVGIQHPRENRIIGQIRFWRGAVATSGDSDRYFEVNGKRYGHIIDPRSGWPAERVYALTILAPNATAADAMSTATYVLGRERGLPLLHSCKDIEGVVITPDDAVPGNVEAAATKMIVTSTFGESANSGNSAIVLQPDESLRVLPFENKTHNPKARDCTFPIAGPKH